MRIRFSALPATLLIAGTAFAQAGIATPNAIQLWRSDNLALIGVGLANSQNSDAAVWHGAPGDVITYFTNAGSGMLRQLDFRGFELGLASFSTNNLNTDQYELVRFQEAVAPNQGRLVPDATTTYATFLSQNIGVIGNGVAFHLGFDLGAGSAVAVPIPDPAVAGSKVGDGIGLYTRNYQTQFGYPGSLFHLYSNGVESAPNISLSGAKFPGSPALFWNDQLVLGATPFNKHELQVTYLFEQSVLSPIKNAFIASNASVVGGPATIVGGGPNPITFAIYGDNGRGALTPTAGDAVSYVGASSYLKSLPGSAVWFVPFTQFEGDLATGVNPAPEDWVGQNGNVQRRYVHKLGVVKHINDVIAAFGGSPPTGALLSPSNPTWAIWLGVDLPSFFNIAELVNSFNAAGPLNPNALPNGPESLRYDANDALHVTAQLGINLVNYGGIAEHGTLTFPQTGFSPISPTFSNPNLVGFGTVPVNPLLVGLTFAHQHWMLDTNSQTTVTIYNVIDVSTANWVTIN